VWGLGLIALGLVSASPSTPTAPDRSAADSISVSRGRRMVRLILPLGLIGAGVALVRDREDDTEA